MALTTRARVIQGDSGAAPLAVVLVGSAIAAAYRIPVAAAGFGLEDAGTHRVEVVADARWILAEVDVENTQVATGAELARELGDPRDPSLDSETVGSVGDPVAAADV